MPPPPPIGPAELEMIVWIAIILVVIIGGIFLLRYLFPLIFPQSKKKPTTMESDEMTELMRELIGEIRGLRQEIKELKEEMEG